MIKLNRFSATKGGYKKEITSCVEYPSPHYYGGEFYTPCIVISAGKNETHSYELEIDMWDMWQMLPYIVYYLKKYSGLPVVENLNERLEAFIKNLPGENMLDKTKAKFVVRLGDEELLVVSYTLPDSYSKTKHDIRPKHAMEMLDQWHDGCISQLEAEKGP